MPEPLESMQRCLSRGNAAHIPDLGRRIPRSRRGDRVDWQLGEAITIHRSLITIHAAVFCPGSAPVSRIMPVRLGLSASRRNSLFFDSLNPTILHHAGCVLHCGSPDRAESSRDSAEISSPSLKATPKLSRLVDSLHLRIFRLRLGHKVARLVL